MKNVIAEVIGDLLIAVAIAGVAVVALLYKPVVEQMLAQQRLTACMQAYQLQFSDTKNNTVVISPNQAEVEKCVQTLGK